MELLLLMEAHLCLLLLHLLLVVEVFIVDGGTIMCNITTLIVIC
jgi:hypothetical protein